MNNNQSEERTIYSVSELNVMLRVLLEDHFPAIWVTGEVSDFFQARSGHWYFKLKDAETQLNCVMFRSHNLNANLPKNGDQLLVHGRISVYLQRGECQLVIDTLEDSGIGALHRAFEKLKQTLSKEGLFDADRKQPLPTFPQRIGIVTSPKGAAIHDILTVLKRRYPLASVIIYPTLVQGEEAIPQIVQAIETAQRRNECDVLMISRGGGSLQDLWAFNTESVARAIAACTLPTITGIGHEIDFTIADFVADYRAPTPSAAAETISPDQHTLHTQLHEYNKQIKHLLSQWIIHKKHQLQYLQATLPHPLHLLQQRMQQLDDFTQRLHRLPLIKPFHQQLMEQIQRLDTLSPLATLTRGYAIITDENKEIIKAIEQTQKGEKITARVSNGYLSCEVISKETHT